MSRRLVSLLAVTFALLWWTRPTEATTITFSGLSGPNGTPLVSYTEAGFTIGGVSGYDQALNFGNPVPDLFGPAGSTFGSLTMKLTAGGEFIFNSVDLGRPTSNAPTYIVDGYLGATPIFSLSNTLNISSDTFAMFLSPSSTPIDALVIAYSMNAGNGLSVINVDNINVTAVPVPEPASLLLIGSGLVSMGARRWNARRQRK